MNTDDGNGCILTFVIMLCQNKNDDSRASYGPHLCQRQSLNPLSTLTSTQAFEPTLRSHLQPDNPIFEPSFTALPQMQPSPICALANTAEKRQRRPLILPFRWINIILHQRGPSSSLDAPRRTVLPSQKSCCSCHWQQSEHPTIPTAISGDPYYPFHHRSAMCKTTLLHSRPGEV